MADEVRADLPTPAHPAPAPGHEQSDIDVRAVLWFGAGLAALAVVIHLGLAGMYFLFKGEENKEKRSDFPLAEQKQQFQSPRLEGYERRADDTQAPGVSTPEDARSTSWADEEKDLVNLPVEEGMRRLLKDPPRGTKGRQFDEVGPRPPSGANSGRGPVGDKK